MLLIELNAWEDEWLVGIQALQEGKTKQKQSTKKKKKILKSDLVCEQIINTCKLDENWNGQNLKNHKRWFFQKNHKISHFCM